VSASGRLEGGAVLYSNRGRFGADEPPCTLRFVTPARVAIAAAGVRRGWAMPCDLPAAAKAPAFAHTRIEAAAPLVAPIAARGVLLDLARAAHRAWLPDGTEIDAAALDDCAERQGVTVEQGDVLLVRTGMLSGCAALGDWRPYRKGPGPGLSPTCARWLYEREVALVATDTPWVEVHRADRAPGALRAVSLAHTGVPFGTSFHLDALSEACAADGSYAFFFVCPAPDASGLAHPVAVK
jgi:hypothetical protein